jgi:speckle-type POZ protein
MDDTGSVVPVTCSDIIGHLEQLLVRGEVGEVRFLVEQSEISAHRLIIAARSPLLYELAVSTDNNNNHVVRIDDMRAAVFRTVLQFIYTDELPPLFDLMVTDRRAGEVIAGDMLAAACRFHLDRMKAMCENLVANYMSEDNMLSMLKLARRYNCSKLEECCIEFISLQHVAKEVLKRSID